MTRSDWHPQLTSLIDLLNRMILELAGEVCHSLDTVTVKSGRNRRPPSDGFDGATNKQDANPVSSYKYEHYISAVVSRSHLPTTYVNCDFPACTMAKSEL